MVGDKGCQTLAICQSKDHFPGVGTASWGHWGRWGRHSRGWHGSRALQHDGRPHESRLTRTSLVGLALLALLPSTAAAAIRRRHNCTLRLLLPRWHSWDRSAKVFMVRPSLPKIVTTPAAFAAFLFLVYICLSVWLSVCLSDFLLRASFRRSSGGGGGGSCSDSGRCMYYN